MGVRVITSALEFPSNKVLEQIHKDVNVDDLKNAIRLVQESGIILNPTFIMFNPWITIEDLSLFREFLLETNIENVVDPVQYQTRLHLYKGSPLLKNESIQALKLEEHEFHYEWFHSDARVDDLFHSSVKPVKEGEFKRCCLKC